MTYRSVAHFFAVVESFFFFFFIVGKNKNFKAKSGVRWNKYLQIRSRSTPDFSRRCCMLRRMAHWIDSMGLEKRKQKVETAAESRSSSSGSSRKKCACR